MRLVNNISIIAKERGLTFKALEREAGLGNGTIKRWEVQSPRLDGLIKVADYLHISLDELVYGERTKGAEDAINLDCYKAEQGLTCDGTPLTEAETDLVAMFRLLPPSHQEELFDLTYFKYKRHVEEKRESIYSTYLDTGANEESGHTQDKAQDATA